VRGSLSTIDARMPADRFREIQRQLPALTRGEGGVETLFDRYQPIRGKPPMRFIAADIIRRL
jgi:ribosomal protection tetracycline resistance protein